MPDLDRLITAIDAAEEMSYGSNEGSELSRERAFALDYYYGRNIEPAPEGRSQVVDRSVFETIQWLLPSLCRIFANGDNVIEFVPFGPEDEKAAQQESDYLNYLITQKNPWFQTFLTWAQDALLMKTAYCMAYIDESVQVESETYSAQPDEALALLLQDENVEVVAHQQYIDESAEPVPVMDDMGNMVLVPATLHDIEIRRTKTQKNLRFKVLPPERCKVSEQTPSVSLEECDYFEYSDDTTISALREQGFDVPDDIADGDENENEVDYARDLYDEDITRDGSSIDPAMRLVRVRMVWLRHDYNEDGIAELLKVIRVGSEILAYEDGSLAIEEVSRIQVAAITPTVNSHRHIGMSVADMVVDIQRIQTAIIRQGLDSLYQSNSPRHAISDKVNLDDMQITAPGWNVRVEDGALPGEGHIMPLNTPFVFPQAIAGMDYFDQVKEKRTGAARYAQGIDPDVMSKAPSGVAVNQLSTMSAQRTEQIARVIASGVKELFAIAHELVLKSGAKNEIVKLRGEWTPVNPAEWRTGRDMRIVVGYGAGNKDALISRIMMILTAQKEAAMGGLRVASEQNIYNSLIELTKAADFSAPERFFTDPAKLPPPEQGPSDTEMLAQVEMEKQNSSERIKGAEIEKDKAIATMRDATTRWSDALQAEVKLKLEQMRQGGSLDLKAFEKQLDDEPVLQNNELAERNNALVGDTFTLIEAMKSAQQQVIESLNKLEEAHNAPREIVKKDGKVVGVKVGDKVRSVKREGNKVVLE